MPCAHHTRANAGEDAGRDYPDAGADRADALIFGGGQRVQLCINAGQHHLYVAHFAVMPRHPLFEDGDPLSGRRFGHAKDAQDGVFCI